ncbi:MAG: hypothetical protein R6U57_05450 [Anaerolineales bacterium]
MSQKVVRIGLVGGALAGSMLACRPVVTVGWSEILILALIILIAIFPLLVKIFRFYLRLEERKEDREDSEK